MKTQRTRRVAYILLLIPMTVALHGYNIKPLSPVHERMTRAAKLCFDQAVMQSSKPLDCDDDLLNPDPVDVSWLHDSSIKDLVGLFRRVFGMSPRYPTLEQAVRWPDDPTRQIKSFGAGKFAVNLWSGCERLAAQRPSGTTNINDGLLCNSHFGDMQFLHAQASHVAESAIETHFKITAWAEFLYLVASDHYSDSQLNQEYCKWFSGDDAFARAMLPSDDSVPCEATRDPAWKITTLFNLKCGNAFQSRGCSEETGLVKYDRARIYAAGALLHLIQDSFSQSHCERGQCETGADKVAKVECKPITMFTTYIGQSGHKDADGMPRFADSCNDLSDIDDPITASAKALWHISNRSSLDEFRSDLYRVFSTPETISEIARPAGLGECFGGEAR